MTMRSRRYLFFEQLEQKALPSSVLLLLATSPDAEQADAGLTVAVESHSEERAVDRWQLASFDTETLLRFIDQNTSADAREVEPEKLPSESECLAADEMMKLDDGELRMMIACLG